MNRLVHLGLGLTLACSRIDQPRVKAQSATPSDTVSHVYGTTFPLAESPISDSGRWLNGGTDGGDWTDVSTTSHRAIGHQVGASYTDATAILKGDWRPDQSATATVFSTGGLDDKCKSEVELRLRSGISLHSNRGYEIAFSVRDSEQAYLIIVKWNGVLGSFTGLFQRYGTRYGVKNGDVVKAMIVGNRITAYKNGAIVGSVLDETYTAGNPGMGFNLENSHAGCPGSNDRYGFSSFNATDILDP